MRCQLDAHDEMRQCANVAEPGRSYCLDHLDPAYWDTYDDRPPQDVQRPEEARFRRWSISDLLSADLTFQWDATGLLVRPTYGLDTGELKSMKSYFGTSRAIGLAAGVPILGEWAVPERRRVLFYVAEGGRIPFTRRLVRLCEAHGVDPADLDGWLCPIFDAGPLDSSTFRDTLRGHLEDFGPAFVHLDPLYAFQAATVDAHRVDQQGRMLSEVHGICAEHEATFWLTAHMNQSGQGFDLKRIAGAGTGEWGDSWVLLKHRETPDVDAGRFRLAVDVGSRQWGGASYELDLDIGRFDADTGSHDGAIKFNVRRAGGGDERSDAETAKRLKARRAVFTAMRKSRKPLTKAEIAERSTGAPNTYIRAEIAALIDERQLDEVGTRKPEHGGKEAPTYELSEGADDV